MNALFTRIFTITLLFTPALLFSQWINGPGTPAGFEIDGDLYQQQQSSQSGPGYQIDWFGFSGQNSGVIDSRNASTILNEISQQNTSRGRNFSFVLRMNPGLTPNAKDALYIRDHISAQSARDSSTFITGASKNADDPASWQTGLPGSPQKNDLVDIFAHLRRENISVSSDLWFMGATSTRSADGNSHVDFEFFREDISFQQGSFASSGTDGGRTAWTLNSDGTINEMGDAIVSVDYLNGGNTTKVSVRLWINASQIPGGFSGWNNLTGIPFEFTGDFNTGVNSGDFGYAEIEIPQSSSAVIYHTANQQRTQASPWGTLSGPRAELAMDYIPMQWMEIAVNMTALGLDATNKAGGTCEPLFGSVLVKTRASQSFTAELKDFAAPQPFGNFSDFSLTAEGGTINCIQTSIIPQLSLADNGISYQWSGPQGYSSNEMTPELTTPGTYIVNAGPAGGCQVSDTILIEADTVRPALAVNSGTITCLDPSFKLIASSPTSGVEFEWSGPGGEQHSGNSWTVSAGGTYEVTVTNSGNGCSTTKSTTINAYLEEPVVSLVDDTLTCTDVSLTIGGSIQPATGVSVSWTGPAGFQSNSMFPTVTEAGVYTVTVTHNQSGCTTTESVSITGQNQLPEIQLSSSGNLTCVFTYVQLSAGNAGSGYNYDWSGPNGFTSQIANPSVTEPGIYSVIVTHPVSGCSETGQITVQSFQQTPSVSIPATDTLNCYQSQLQVSLPSGYNYQWTGPEGFQSYSPTPVITVAGTYQVVVKDQQSGCDTTLTIDIYTDFEKPVVSVTGSNITCKDTVVTINATVQGTDSVSFLWLGPNGFFAQTRETTISQPGTYRAYVRNLDNGCLTIAYLTIQDERAPIPVSLTAGTLTCDIDTVSLSYTAPAGGVYTHTWTGPGGFISHELSPDVTIGGTYYLIVKDTVSGCTGQGTVRVNEDRTPPPINLVKNSDLNCITSLVTLSAITGSGSFEYEWVGPNGSLGTAQFVQVTEAGTYQGTVTNLDNGCTNTKTIVVNENYHVPDATITASDSLNCDNPTVNLTVSADQQSYLQYFWTGPNNYSSNSSSPTVNTAGVYTLRLTDQLSGCDTTLQVTVTGDPTPFIISATGGTLTCNDSTVTLSVSYDTSREVKIVWTGQNFFSSDVNPVVTEGGYYQVTVTDTVRGCVATTLVRVIDQSGPLQMTVGAGTLGCEGSYTNLFASYQIGGSYIFNWSGPDGFYSGKPAPMITEPGTYVLTLTNTQTGCTGTDSVTVIRNEAAPVFSLYKSGDITCNNTTVRLYVFKGSGSYAFKWEGPNGFTSAVQYPFVTEEGLYYVTVKNLVTNCEAVDSIRVIARVDAPIASLNKPDTLTCYNPTTSLNITIPAGANYRYQWSGPGGFSSSSSIVNVSNAGEYKVVITNVSTGCTLELMENVIENKRTPVVTLHDADLTCQSPFATLIAMTEGTGTFNFSWSGPAGFNASGELVNVQEAGLYQVKVTDVESGCASVAQAEVFPAPPCSDALCTQTQGFYGSKNGKFCDGSSTTEVLEELLSERLVIGGAANRFELTAADIPCFYTRMPGGGPSIPLNGVATCSNPVGIPLDNSGAFDNNLLAQTITLGLNLRLSGGLGNVLIEGTQIITMASSDCQDENATAVPGTERTFGFPASVLTYLQEATVSEVYKLANQALAGTYTFDGQGPTLGEITHALGTINEAFDGCRILKGFDGGTEEKTWDVQAYPNPSRQEPVSFSFKAETTGKAKLSVHHMVTGEVLGVLMTIDVIEGQRYESNALTGNWPEGTYYFMLQVDGAIVDHGNFQIYH